MKRVGAIRDFYPVHKNVQKRAGIQRLEKELSRRFIFVILQDSLKYDLAVQEVYMMSFPGRRVNFAYKTVVELCQKKTGIFIFNTVDGVKAQDYLLQKKIGGSIICCIY